MANVLITGQTLVIACNCLSSRPTLFFHFLSPNQRLLKGPINGSSDRNESAAADHRDDQVEQNFWIPVLTA